MKNVHCSFCGRKEEEVKMLIAGLHGHICSDCATQAHRIIAEEVKEEKNEKPVAFKNYKPLGGKAKKVDVRVLAATNQNLPKLS